jgi:hypothetical protein
MITAKVAETSVAPLEDLHNLCICNKATKKGAVKLVVFNGEDFGYWKNRIRNYLLSQGRAIWEIVQELM